MHLPYQRFFRPVSLLSISNVSSFRLLPLRVRKPLFTNGSIVPRVQGVRFNLAHFVSPPLSYMKQVPFESAGIRLQNMQKLSVYTVQGLRYMLWYADQNSETPHSPRGEKMSTNEASVRKSTCNGTQNLCTLAKSV